MKAQIELLAARGGDAAPAAAAAASASLFENILNELPFSESALLASWQVQPMPHSADAADAAAAADAERSGEVAPRLNPSYFSHKSLSLRRGILAGKSLNIFNEEKAQQLFKKVNRKSESSEKKIIFFLV